MNKKGFVSIPVIIVILIASLAGGALVRYQIRHSKKIATIPSPMSNLDHPSNIVLDNQQPAPSSAVLPVANSPVTNPSAKQNKISAPAAPIIVSKIPSMSLAEQFAILDGEVRNAQVKMTFFSPDHAIRILNDLHNLEIQGYSKSEIERLRQIVHERSSLSQDQTKQNQTALSAPTPTYSSSAQSNCQSNSSPVFTNHITDMSKVNYIGPPPTMGAGPNLKTHSYIGTDHARVPVYAPATMTLESGSYYVGGPYMIEFLVSCEVRVRFGHITEPVEAIRKLLPSEPKQDSRSQELAPITFAAGDLVGYTTGTDLAGN